MALGNMEPETVNKENTLTTTTPKVYSTISNINSTRISLVSFVIDFFYKLGSIVCRILNQQPQVHLIFTAKQLRMKD